MEVKIKDRKKNIELFRVACNMAKISINYQHADLILRIQQELKKQKGDYTINDSVEILYNWEQEYNDYFEKQLKDEAN